MVVIASAFRTYDRITSAEWMCASRYFGLLLDKLRRGDRIHFNKRAVDLLCTNLTDAPLFTAILAEIQIKQTHVYKHMETEATALSILVASGGSTVIFKAILKDQDVPLEALRRAVCGGHLQLVNHIINTEYKPTSIIKRATTSRDKGPAKWIYTEIYDEAMQSRVLPLIESIFTLITTNGRQSLLSTVPFANILRSIDDLGLLQKVLDHPKSASFVEKDFLGFLDHGVPARLQPQTIAIVAYVSKRFRGVTVDIKLRKPMANESADDEAQRHLVFLQMLQDMKVHNAIPLRYKLRTLIGLKSLGATKYLVETWPAICSTQLLEYAASDGTFEQFQYLYALGNKTYSTAHCLDMANCSETTEFLLERKAPCTYLAIDNAAHRCDLKNMKAIYSVQPEFKSAVYTSACNYDLEAIEFLLGALGQKTGTRLNFHTEDCRAVSFMAENYVRLATIYRFEQDMIKVMMDMAGYFGMIDVVKALHVVHPEMMYNLMDKVVRGGNPEIYNFFMDNRSEGFTWSGLEVLGGFGTPDMFERLKRHSPETMSLENGNFLQLCAGCHRNGNLALIKHIHDTTPIMAALYISTPQSETRQLAGLIQLIEAAIISGDIEILEYYISRKLDIPFDHVVTLVKRVAKNNYLIISEGIWRCIKSLNK
eukprot:gene5695-6579_t